MSTRAQIAKIAAVAAVATIASPAMAAPCPPARAGSSIDALSLPWRHAVDALILASATEGQVWSCSGGTIDLIEHQGGATLTVVGADGHAVSREVTLPEDVEPLGEALLAKPIVTETPALPPPVAQPIATPPAEPDKASKSSDAVPRAEQGAPEKPPPRVIVSAVIQPRYAGGSNLMWGGINLGAAIPFGPWVAGAWLRYDGPNARLDNDHIGEMSELAIGANAGRTFKLDPIELRTSAIVSAAVVTRHGQQVNEETHVAGRFGAEARASLPITSLFRAVLAFDGDVAPAEIRDSDHKPQPTTPDKDESRYVPFPTYTFGLGLGVELTPR